LLATTSSFTQKVSTIMGSNSLPICLLIICIVNIVKSGIVNTKIGHIEGNDGTDVNTFFGIPFAKPPINELRFASPQPITEPIGNISNPFQAKGPRESLPGCIQPFIPGFTTFNGTTEDCLFLNVYAPSNAQYQKTNYTVMIWIYGGGYVFGASTEPTYDATNMVSFIGDIIMVTINYRVSILGFLYDNSFDTGVTGNYGYEDQKLAIKWVYDNIAYFGGNPDNINIFGESAGGGAVALQLLYNNDGYIKSGIMQSPWPNPFKTYPTPSSWDDVIPQFNKLVNCTHYESSSNELLNCWRTADSNTILTASLGLYIWNPNVLLIPTVGNTTELLYQPLWGFTNGKIDNIPPYIIGTNKAEGYLLVSGVNDTYPGALEAVANGLLDGNFEIAAAVLDHYGVTMTKSKTGNYPTDYGLIWSDIWRCSVIYQLELLGDNTDNIYYYNFDVVNPILAQSLFNPTAPSCWNTTCHGVDLFYLFTAPVFGQFFDNKTIAIGEEMQILWSNFAKTYNPNNDDEGNVDNIWPKYTNKYDNENLLDFEDYNKYVKKSTDTDIDYVEICSFWNKVGYSGNFSNPTMVKDGDMTTTNDGDEVGASLISTPIMYIVISFLVLFLSNEF